VPAEPSSAQIASARATWTAAGLDGAAFDEAAGTTPPPNSAAPPGSTTDPGDLSAPTPVFYNDSDRAPQFAQALLNAGVDPQLVAQAAKADGLDMTLPAPDARTDDERGWDQAFAAAASPADYNIDYAGLNIADIPAADFAEFDQELRAVAMAAKLPASFGGNILAEALQDMDAYSAMT
jgi:hypothetical protein